MWFDKSHFSELLFNDLKVKDYLSGVFYNLKAPTSYFMIERFSSGLMCIHADVYFSRSFSFKNIVFRSRVFSGLPHLMILFKRKSLFKLLLSLQWLNLFLDKHYKERAFIRKQPKKAPRIVTNRILLARNTSTSLSLFYSILKYSRVSPIVKRRNILYSSIILFIYRRYIKYRFLRRILQGLLIQELCYVYFYLNKTHFLLPLNIFSSVRSYSFKLSRFFSYIFVSALSTLSLNFIRDYQLRRQLVQNSFLQFKLLMESSITSYLQQPVFLFFNFYLFKRPSFLSAKLVCDYILYNLEKGVYLNKIFSGLRRWQMKMYSDSRKFESLYYLLKSKYSNGKYSSISDVLYLYSQKKNCVLGLRVECVGTSKKGKMARRTFYSDWVREPLFSGRMPNNTIRVDIDYYQSFAIRKSSTSGIKVWVYFNTIVYNSKSKYISLNS